MTPLIDCKGYFAKLHLSIPIHHCFYPLVLKVNKIDIREGVPHSKCPIKEDKITGAQAKF